MKKIKILAFLAVITLLPLSCDDSVLDTVNPNNLAQETFFSNELQANEGLIATYSAIHALDLYGRRYFFNHDLTSDDLDSGPNLQGELVPMFNFTFDASNPSIRDMWRGLYRGVQRANQVITNVNMENNKDPLFTQDEIDRIVAEAKFLRAFFYFELVSLWGDVPLLTQPSSAPESIGKSPAADVYALIRQDLNDAQAVLPLRSQTDVWRASKGAAQSLLGKIELFLGNYDAARTEFTKVISSGEYALVDRYLDNFEEETENNSESIFELQLNNSFGGSNSWSADGSGPAQNTFRGIEYGFNDFNNVVPSATLLAEFEDGDPRKSDSFYTTGDLYNNDQDTATFTGFRWRKYQRYYKRASDGFDYSGINFRIIRYADVLMMQAECENELSGPSAALPLINQIRTRASVNMPEYGTAEMDAAGFPVGTQAQMLAAIQHERFIEFSGEQIRKRDIIRWGIAKEKIEATGRSYDAAKHDLFPIPLEEIDANSAISQSDQNPGY